MGSALTQQLMRGVLAFCGEEIEKAAARMLPLFFGSRHM